MLIRAASLFLFLFLASGAYAGSEEAILVRLFHAQNEDVPDDLKDDEPIKKSLIEILGYLRYHQLGTSYARLDTTDAQWLLPSSAFFLQFRVSNPSTQAYHFELYQDKQPILGGEFTPKPKVPLIITGPMYDRGKLVMVMTVCLKKDIPNESSKTAELTEVKPTASATADKK